jgi:hypothetical protein
MQHVTFSKTEQGLRGPELRLIELLRYWDNGPDAREGLWRGLRRHLGSARANSCLDGFSDMMGLLRRHGWHMPTILPVTARGYSEDELAIARFVMAATEQRRDVALQEASFLVSPQALLPMLNAAMRTGLPLLCEDCRARVMARPARVH